MPRRGERASAQLFIEFTQQAIRLLPYGIIFEGGGVDDFATESLEGLAFFWVEADRFELAFCLCQKRASVSWRIFR